MHRRDFIKNGCAACLSMTAIAPIVAGCGSTKYASGQLGKDGLTVSKKMFEVKQNGGRAYSSFIIIRNDALNYPVCIYRLSDKEYTALWMKCTHAGAELQTSGDMLQCPAHGSEFNNRGQMTSGPADTNLRTFPVEVRDDELFIDMRKQS